MSEDHNITRRQFEAITAGSAMGALFPGGSASTIPAAEHAPLIAERYAAYFTPLLAGDFTHARRAYGLSGIALPRDIEEATNIARYSLVVNLRNYASRLSLVPALEAAQSAHPGLSLKEAMDAFLSSAMTAH